MQGAGTRTAAIPKQHWPHPTRGIRGQGVHTSPQCHLGRAAALYPASVSPPEALGFGDSPQEVAEGVEEAGEHGRQHQLWEDGGVSGGRGGSLGLPPPPHTYLVLLAAPHHIEEEVDAAPVDDGESFQTGDLTCAAWGHGTVLVSPGTVQEGMLPQAWCPSGIKPFATVSPPKGGTHPPPSPPARWVLLKTLLSKAACSLAVGKVPS